MKNGRKESHTKGLEFLNCATQLGRIVFDIEEEGVIRNDLDNVFGNLGCANLKQPTK